MKTYLTSVPLMTLPKWYALVVNVILGPKAFVAAGGGAFVAAIGAVWPDKCAGVAIRPAQSRAA
jgi:hypothetical protein